MKYIFQGIEGLGSKFQPFGNVVTIGERGPSGAPTNVDKFFIKKPNALLKKFGKRTQATRENDPEFIRYNNSERPELRQNIRWEIVHDIHLKDGWASMVDGFQFQLIAQQLPNQPKHPRNAPACTGDGNNAQRWNGEEYVDINCPNRGCQFRQGITAPCKPRARFAVKIWWQPDQPWSNLPTPTIMFSTHSWHNIGKVFMPFFENLHKQAMGLGYTNYSFYGLKGKLGLGKRKTQKGGAVPAITMTTEFEPGTNFRDFLIESEKLRPEKQHETLLQQNPEEGESL